MKINIQAVQNEHVFFREEEVCSFFLVDALRPYYPGSARLVADVERIGKDLKVSLFLNTEGEYQCDRCLVTYKAVLENKLEQMFHFGSGGLADSEEVIALPGDLIELDLRQMQNEIVVLNHPLKMLCKEDCKGICPDCGADLNIEACRCGEAKVDPRWDELKKLIR
jgi:uncharacterized protein